MSTVPALPAGETAVMLFEELMVKLAADAAPNLTAKTPVKLAPVMLTGVPPADGPCAGLMPTMEGAAALMANATPDDAPPDSVTVTVAVPAAVSKLAGTVAVSCVLLAKIVVRDAPVHFTTASEVKLLPLTARVIAALPTVAEAGERPVIDGTAP
jgi:hypothetical protein